MKNFRALTRVEWKSFFKLEKIVIASASALTAFWVIPLIIPYLQTHPYFVVAVSGVISAFVTDVLD